MNDELEGESLMESPVDSYIITESPTIQVCCTLEQWHFPCILLLI